MSAKKARRRTKAEVADEKQVAAEARVVLWAETHGAPVRLLEGWNPADGTWAMGSPVGNMLGLIQQLNFPTVAARLAGVTDLGRLVAKGNEYVLDAPENRAYIAVEVLPFIDLVRQLDIAESVAETELVKVARRGALGDPKLAIAMLGRRFATRWREQQAIFTGEDTDERDKAVSLALTDPNTALALGQIAHAIEDQAPRDE